MRTVVSCPRCMELRQLDLAGFVPVNYRCGDLFLSVFGTTTPPRQACIEAITYHDILFVIIVLPLPLLTTHAKYLIKKGLICRFETIVSCRVAGRGSVGSVELSFPSSKCSIKLYVRL